MSNHINFNDMKWFQHFGSRVKEFEGDKYTIRIVEFYDDFVEEDWCQAGHIGYILEGEMKIDFGDKVLTYQKGDGIYINSGEKEKHKAIVEKGKTVKLLLFEEN